MNNHISDSLKLDIFKFKVKIYIPLLYSEKIKRPGKRYFLNNIIGEDFIILWLSFAYTSSHLLLSSISIFLLLIAFWCIYELGYIENDIIGDKYEDKAVLSHNYKSGEYSFGLWQPWLWSLGLSILGIIALENNKIFEISSLDVFTFHGYEHIFSDISAKLIYWGFFLLALRGIFYVYNNINKQSRVWFYLLLQTFRYCGFLIIITTNTVGLMLLVSCILTRSIQYILYRYLGGQESSWPMDFPRYFFCLLIYILLIGILAVNSRDLSLIFNFQVLLICSFCLLRGRKGFTNVFANFLPVSQDGSNGVT
ncbi:hypothetical protein [Pleurocapsa sp. PCC 7319]|uniref:hypothetical protein n=1 Tax=Pleurocapsa sp. PCC 7319 TaxID=118161 RepID=UPI00034CC5EC|nr:hypothetical protein [Pleurocapsa sp. PCC 7319]